MLTLLLTIFLFVCSTSRPIDTHLNDLTTFQVAASPKAFQFKIEVMGRVLNILYLLKKRMNSYPQQRMFKVSLSTPETGADISMCHRFGLERLRFLTLTLLFFYLITECAAGREKLNCVVPRWPLQTAPLVAGQTAPLR